MLLLIDVFKLNAFVMSHKHTHTPRHGSLEKSINYQVGPKWENTFSNVYYVVNSGDNCKSLLGYDL